MAAHNWAEVFTANNGYCTYCEVDLLANISTFWSAQRDHVHPLASDGEDSLSNMVISCPSCNQALSREKNLITVGERKEFIRKKYEERKATYDEWVRDLRGQT